MFQYREINHTKIYVFYKTKFQLTSIARKPSPTQQVVQKYCRQLKFSEIRYLYLTSSTAYEFFDIQKPIIKSGKTVEFTDSPIDKFRNIFDITRSASQNRKKNILKFISREVQQISQQSVLNAHTCTVLYYICGYQGNLSISHDCFTSSC